MYFLRCLLFFGNSDILIFFAFSLGNFLAHLVFFYSGVNKCGNDLNHIEDLLRIPGCHGISIDFLGDILGELIEFVDEFEYLVDGFGLVSLLLQG